MEFRNKLCLFIYFVLFLPVTINTRVSSIISSKYISLNSITKLAVFLLYVRYFNQFKFTLNLRVSVLTE